MHVLITLLIFALPLVSAQAAPLYQLKIQKVADRVYALVGELGQRSPENLGNNATFGVVLTDKGPVLIDAGGTFQGAKQIAAAVRTLTDKPVIAVINTGGQDQRWLGNTYFKKHDRSRIIASKAAVEDQRARADDQIDTLERLVGKEGLRGTVPVYADQTFEKALDVSIGGIDFEIRNPGAAHTPGDSYVWLPKLKVLFSGDIIYVERMLSVSSVSKSGSWIKSFGAISLLKPDFIVPGHGHVTTLTKARTDTYDYLTMLRTGAKDLIKRGIGLESISEIDQSRFHYLKFYKELKGPNAHQVFQEIEWE